MKIDDLKDENPIEKII